MASRLPLTQISVVSSIAGVILVLVLTCASVGSTNPNGVGAALAIVTMLVVGIALLTVSLIAGIKSAKRDKNYLGLKVTVIAFLIAFMGFGLSVVLISN